MAHIDGHRSSFLFLYSKLLTNTKGLRCLICVSIIANQLTFRAHLNNTMIVLDLTCISKFIHHLIFRTMGILIFVRWRLLPIFWYWIILNFLILHELEYFIGLKTIVKLSLDRFVLRWDFQWCLILSFCRWCLLRLLLLDISFWHNHLTALERFNSWRIVFFNWSRN